MSKKFIVMFSNTNYQVSTGGTERVARNLEKQYLEKKINVLNIFPIKWSKNVVGLNLNGKYKGFYKLTDLKNIIGNFCQNEYECIGIMIHHLKGYNLNILGEQLYEMNIDIILEIHDFYLICNTFNFLKNKKEYCGLSSPNRQKCHDCYNYHSLKVFQKSRDNFLSMIHHLVTKIIFPSEFCMKTWLTFFPEYKEISFVRSNLTYHGVFQKKNNNNKLKLAYIGKKNIHKGIETWNKIIHNDNLKDKFDFYYFGVDIENNSNVYEVFTKCNMESQLRDNNIDIVLLWSIIPETYSYTYYEASSSCAIILTSSMSGNIVNQIKKNKNGYIFQSEGELIQFLENHDSYKTLLQNLQIFSPQILLDNKSLDLLSFPQNSYIYLSQKKGKKLLLLSQLYYLKKIKNL